MPPTKKTNNLDAIAKKKKVTKRLMEISLKVDRYIYKNRPISSEEAAVLNDEMQSYKAKCQEDERSLQVIEKLTRLLQKIMKEQCAEKEIHNDHSSPFGDNSLQDLSKLQESPVHSLTKEDKTYQELNTEDQTGDEISIDIDVGDQNLIAQKKTSKGPFTLHNSISSFDDNTIDLCSDNKRINKNELHNKKNVDDDAILIIRDLSISKPVEPNIDDDTNCSQSILNNVESLEPFYPMCLNEPRCAQDSTDIDREIRNLIKLKPKMNVIFDQSVKQKLRPNKKSNAAINRSSNKKPQIDACPKVHIQSKTPVDKYHTTDELLFRKGKIDKLNKVLKPLQLKESDKPQTMKRANENVMPHFDLSNTKEKKTVQKIKSRRSRMGKFQEDLSWVENITYVREIDLDEYDDTSNITSDTFWDNYDLPAGCNVREFDDF